MSVRALFLDRDGTLMVDVGYPSLPEQVELLPGAAEALAALREAGYRLSIISNQSGVGRGYFDAAAVEAVHQRLLDLLAVHGVPIDDAEYCLHAPEDGCDCRKPSPLMIRRSADRLGVDPAQSFMIGDKASDIEAGRRAGCRTILLDPTGAGGTQADFVCRDWEDIVQAVRRITDRPVAAGSRTGSA
ncbi:D-glycero-D-manno-heptose 1,7-bisphosphate phosphatase [Thioalkalivibrio nitratireducens DSM 14787]|uniref:D,D-heptose 1,7-bisphosphate phosphatase n=1 Tax=Thioalkalivibrio nitratireducens (strain DSM 14787 / UNIQEM 213 / ALEN2) TaxID=1255043 RepID=L0DZE8_THIND|nr:HAD family hydrolase [Thioalkalivibrio nitratireducens]AGA34340.1 D-glycero-D-manno-heptose 1,7-bisphosphate phosphatase [Thioalkalivibrio nitratireducens DSM 14787]